MISSDRRRAKVMNTLKDFGLRVQYSVFECELTAARAAELRNQLHDLMDRRTDKVHIYVRRLLGKSWNRSVRA